MTSAPNSQAGLAVWKPHVAEAYLQLGRMALWSEGRGGKLVEIPGGR